MSEDHPYRDDLAAARDRIGGLERELEARRELPARRKALERELADTRRAVYRASLPVLEDIRISAPCDESWDDMPGTERLRFCGRCNKHVYNLSRMTRFEAETFIRSIEGPCVRLYRRADGTVVTASCPVLGPDARIGIVLAMPAALLALVLLLAWCQQEPAESMGTAREAPSPAAASRHYEPTMGLSPHCITDPTHPDC